MQQKLRGQLSVNAAAVVRYLYGVPVGFGAGVLGGLAYGIGSDIAGGLRALRSWSGKEIWPF